MNPTSSAPALVADICLYGVTHAGYLVRTVDGRMAGTGDPVTGRSFTEAVWLALASLAGLGVTTGIARVFEPSGKRVAVVDLGGRVPAFGDMVWHPAPTYTISAEALIAAAEEVR